MKLSVEILAHFLSQEKAQILFPELRLNGKKILELQCYHTLYKIHKIVRDDSQRDPECFERIENDMCI